MSSLTDPRVDDHIAMAPGFARPILTHLRALIHQGCPEAQETIKWGRPSFTYKGKLLCGMAAFKAHCRFGFWHPEMSEHIARDSGMTGEKGSQFGQIARLADLPDAVTLLGYITEATRLNEAGASARRKGAGTPAPKKPELPLPEDFSALLKRNPAAARTFEHFAPGQRREYLEWIGEAKRAETRTKRLATAMEWLAEGKIRNWKYQGC